MNGIESVNIRQKINPKRIVVKIGTRVLDSEKIVFNQKRIKSIVSELSQIHKSGKDILVVSSGAVGAGMRELNISKNPYS